MGRHDVETERLRRLYIRSGYPGSYEDWLLDLRAGVAPVSGTADDFRFIAEWQGRHGG